MAETPRTLTIFFTDGDKMTIEFDRQAGDAATLGTRLQKVLAAREIMVDMDGTLTVIPMENVKYYQVEPAPAVLPDTILRGARQLTDEL